jgi:TM2 domain-containing membrane protein YozV/Tfp pilus assembly protein PilE
MAEMIICRGCKKEIHRTARACPHCGAPQVGAKRGKHRIGAALLAFFLGGLGIHRFYLGQWWGIFYLLFFWTLIPGLVAFVEFIVFLCTSDERWNEKYNDGMQPEGGGTTLIIIIVAIAGGMFIFVALMGILAAIALPAYHDYLQRGRTAEALSHAKVVAAAVGAHYETTETIPASLEAIGVAQPQSNWIESITIDPSNGMLTVTLDGVTFEGKTFYLEPGVDNNKSVVWTCVPGTIRPQLLPSECRGGTSGN